MIERYTSGSDPVLSVVIPTIPSSSHQSVVSKLKKQNADFDYEVIVINDSELDICEARNQGIKNAKAEIVALTDDDCLPPLNWLKSIYSTYCDSESRLSCVEGTVTGGLNYSGTRHYVGCNLTFMRSEALKIGGFSSEFAGYRDDTEFGWRMEKESEGKCIFEDSIQMVHPDRPRSNYNRELDDKLEENYPERYNSIFMSDMRERIYLKLSRIGITGKINELYNNIVGVKSE
ncbi:glycosyltransferase family 2 protein [Haloferax volcanii]|nr:glycosyltransferase [Haloferax volcanii]